VSVVPTRLPLGAKRAPFSGTPVREALQGAATAIGAAGSNTPRLDAEVLLADVLGIERGRLLSDSTLQVSGPAVRAYQDAVRRRSVGREPVAYITGRRGFRHIDLRVDPRVLIPRPETELLVEVGLTVDVGASVLDVGTGSGAVALALKDERPDLAVTGVDVSADAVAVARGNASRLGLDVPFAVGDLLSGAVSVDAVLANLPYVESGAALPADVAEFEPALALFAGSDGLDVVRRLIEAIGALDAAGPNRPGLIALELAPSQTGVVAGLLLESGCRTVEVLQDLAGRERVVVGRS
jgi:release factor glutamine methyltransferase